MQKCNSNTWWKGAWPRLLMGRSFVLWSGEFVIWGGGGPFKPGLLLCYRARKTSRCSLGLVLPKLCWHKQRHALPLPPESEGRV